MPGKPITEAKEAIFKSITAPLRISGIPWENGVAQSLRERISRGLLRYTSTTTGNRPRTIQESDLNSLLSETEQFAERLLECITSHQANLDAQEDARPTPVREIREEQGKRRTLILDSAILKSCIEQVCTAIQFAILCH